MTDKRINIAILGASGYTGAELLRLLYDHPNASVTLLTGDSQAGKTIGEVYPHLAAYYEHTLMKIDDADFSGIDLVFCCLPHAATQKVIAGLPEHLKIIDLSADFRLQNPDDYAHWYGHAHHAPELQKKAVYGLSEIHRDAIRKARLVANPGCYPTSVILPLHPLVEHKAIDTQHVIVNAMSGVTGAGRSAKQALLYCEVNESVRAYSVGGHRHVAEMEQELSIGEQSSISFTPHLVPMNRGISSTIHITLKGGDAEVLYHIWRDVYADEPFIRLLPYEHTPATHHVRGSNTCHIGIVPGRTVGHAIIVSVIDNLIKGASGQAIQNMNIMFGLEETTGLDHTGMMP